MKNTDAVKRGYRSQKERKIIPKQKELLLELQVSDFFQNCSDIEKAI